MILVRFLDMSDSDRVYRARFKPKRRGLIVLESVTNERLVLLNSLKEIKFEEGSPVVSYFTQSGTVLVRTSLDKNVPAKEVPFGLNKDQLRKYCKGEKVAPSPASVREHFRAIHASGQHGFNAVSAPASISKWIPVQNKKNKGNPRQTGGDHSHSHGSSNNARGAHAAGGE